MAIQQRAVALVLALASGLFTSGLIYMTLSQEDAPEAQDRAPAVAAERRGAEVPPTDDAPAGLWQRIPPGMRAVTVPVNEVASVAGFVRPGVRVDVIAVKRDEDDWTSAVLAQDLPVLAVSQDDTPQEAKAKLATSATLLATLDQSLAISKACESGKVRLVMRGPRDRAVEVTKQPQTRKLKAEEAKPVRPAASSAPQQVKQAAQPAVAPAPARVEPRGPQVEVIRGSDVEVQRL